MDFIIITSRYAHIFSLWNMHNRKKNEWQKIQQTSGGGRKTLAVWGGLYCKTFII